MSILQCIDVEKIYRSGKNSVHALQKINYTFEAEKITAIIGPSGSGKSTLLNILGGMDKPDAGKVLFQCEDIQGYKEKRLAEYRRKNIGFIFQNYNLLENLTVCENVLLPQLLEREKRNQDWIEELVDAVGLRDKYMAPVSELSGGQQQRVAIVRALANKPEILLCDEPTGNLDVENGKKIMQLLHRINENYHRTIILVTHNMEIAETCDTIVRIVDGKLYKET